MNEVPPLPIGYSMVENPDTDYILKVGDGIFYNPRSSWLMVEIWAGRTIRWVMESRQTQKVFLIIKNKKIETEDIQPPDDYEIVKHPDYPVNPNNLYLYQTNTWRKFEEGNSILPLSFYIKNYIGIKIAALKCKYPFPHGF